MKLRIFTSLIFISFLIAFLSSSTNAQKCKKDFKMCKAEDLGDFDYSSQTSFARLSQGDTARLKIVAFSGKSYRVLLCAEPELGQVAFKIFKSIRKETSTFTVDTKGDTAWTFKELYEEKEVFDSKTKTYWEANINESGRYFIDIYVPVAKDSKTKIDGGCIGVFVGTKVIRSKEIKGKGFAKDL